MVTDFEESPALVLVADPAGRIVFFNRTCERVTGYQRDEVIGRKLDELLLPPVWRDLARERLTHANNDPLHLPHISPWVTKHGEERLIEWRCMPLDGTNTQTGSTILGIGYEIPASAPMARRHAIAPLAEEDRWLKWTSSTSPAGQDGSDALEEICAVLGRDLPSPLHAIEGLITVLQTEHALPPEAQHTASSIRDAAFRMNKLVSELLAFGQVVSTPLDLRATSLEPILERVIGNLQSELQHTGGQAEFHGPFPIVLVDPKLLFHGLSYLLTASIKAVPQGQAPRIQVWTDVQQHQARVWIHDNATAMEPHQRQQLFKSFAEIPAREVHASDGIGLAIVRRAIERMAGTIGVHNEEGQGNLFWIELVIPAGRSSLASH